MKVGLIRVLTLSDEKEINKHGRIIENAFPDLKVISKCIQKQPQGIYDQKSEKEAEPKVADLAKSLSNNKKIEAIIVSCAADPAVNELKKMLDLPVIGAGESLSCIASALGRSIGVLAIGDHIPAVVKEVLGDRLSETMGLKNVKNTLDLKADTAVENSLNAARQLINRGSDAIALACTGFSTVGIAKKLSRELNVPVVDPVIASGSVIYNLALTKGD